MPVTLVAQLASYDEGVEKRSSDRRVLRLRIASSVSAGDRDVLIHNLSHRGLLLETDALLRPRDALVVELPEAGSTLAEVVWSRGGFAGCRFETPLPTAIVSATLLRSEPKIQPANAESLPAYIRESEFSSEDESPLIQTLTIIALIIALGIATLLVVALLSFPFSTQ